MSESEGTTVNRNACTFCFLVLALAGWSGCSSEPPGKSGQAAAARDKIQGKAEIIEAEATATDAALNAGGPSVYLSQGLRRYRLFFKTAIPVDAGQEYIAEGVYAQKAIDESGEPDQGKNGYPLRSSCERIVKTAWPGLAFDATDGQAAVLRTRVNRYPARPVFLVTKLSPVASKEGGEASTKPKKAADTEEKVVTVPADKQRALLIEGPAVQPAPLWAPAGETVRCKLVIDTEGKVCELETGIQLCEATPWSEFRYRPRVQSGHPVNVETEVEVRFEPRK